MNDRCGGRGGTDMARLDSAAAGEGWQPSIDSMPGVGSRSKALGTLNAADRGLSGELA